MSLITHEKERREEKNPLITTESEWDLWKDFGFVSLFCAILLSKGNLDCFSDKMTEINRQKCHLSSSGAQIQGK